MRRLCKTKPHSSFYFLSPLLLRSLRLPLAAVPLPAVATGHLFLSELHCTNLRFVSVLNLLSELYCVNLPAVAASFFFSFSLFNLRALFSFLDLVVCSLQVGSARLYSSEFTRRQLDISKIFLFTL
jgi:hypothetical protein